MKMKLCTLLTLVTLLFTQCKKEPVEQTPDTKNLSTQKAKTFLQQQMTNGDFAALDWSKTRVYTQDGVEKTIRVPLLGNTKALQPAVYLTYSGSRFTGNYTEVRESQQTGDMLITISLNKQKRQEAKLTADGRIGSYKNYEKDRLVFDSELTNSVVSVAAIRAYFTTSNGSQYMWIINSGGGGGQSGGGVGYEPNNSQLTESYVQVDGDQQPDQPEYEIVDIEVDDSESEPEINIDNYLRCFTQISSVGAIYEVKLFVDIPVDKHPGWEMDYNLFNIGVGHTFIRITKINGIDTVSQVLGFYPKTGIKSLSFGGVESKMVDNGRFFTNERHIYNASMTAANVSQAQFDSVLYKIKENSQKSYDLDGFNCTSFALDAFNIASPTTVICNPLIVYTGNYHFFSASPSGLYKTLEAYKSNLPSISSNIEVDVKKRPLYSKGPCL